MSTSNASLDGDSQILQRTEADGMDGSGSAEADESKTTTSDAITTNGSSSSDPQHGESKVAPDDTKTTRRSMMDDIAGLPSGRVLKVSGSTRAKSAAGAIAHISRQDECPHILATGPTSINQAIKAVAIARDYLAGDQIEITCFPEFRRDLRVGLVMRLVKSARDHAASHESDNESSSASQSTELKVSKASTPASVAGAIANKVRESSPVHIVAIGPEAVTHSVRALFLAGKYMEQDGIDIPFRPEFTMVRFNDGRESSALKFSVVPCLLVEQAHPTLDGIDDDQSLVGQSE